MTTDAQSALRRTMETYSKVAAHPHQPHPRTRTLTAPTATPSAAEPSS